MNKSNIVGCFYRHFYSTAVLEMFIRILEVEESTFFYEAEKLKIYQSFVKAMESGWEYDEIVDILENYKSLLCYIYEKT